MDRVAGDFLLLQNKQNSNSMKAIIAIAKMNSYHKKLL